MSAPLLQPGDLAFIRSTSLVSKLIRWGSGAGAQVSHCALVLDTYGTIIEANITGVEATNLWDKYVDLEHEVAIYRPMNLSSQQKSQLLWDAKKHLGRRYGFVAIVQQLVDRKLLGGRVVTRAWNIPGVEICSELLIDLMNGIGLRFGMKPGVGSPEDMFRFCKMNYEKYAPVWVLGRLER